MDNVKSVSHEEGRTRGSAEPYRTNQVPSAGEDWQAAPVGPCGGFAAPRQMLRVNIWQRPESDKTIALVIAPRIGRSFYLTVSDTGEILGSNPPLTKLGSLTHRAGPGNGSSRARRRPGTRPD